MLRCGGHDSNEDLKRPRKRLYHKDTKTQTVISFEPSWCLCVFVVHCLGDSQFRPRTWKGRFAKAAAHSAGTATPPSAAAKSTIRNPPSPRLRRTSPQSAIQNLKSKIENAPPAATSFGMALEFCGSSSLRSFFRARIVQWSPGNPRKPARTSMTVRSCRARWN